jgi:hypothetical protein
MKFRRFLIAPLVAFSLLPGTGSLYSFPVVGANHNGHSAQPSKPAEYHYICPMHEDVTSKKPGKCPKCKMKLEKKRIKPPAVKPPDQ